MKCRISKESFIIAVKLITCGRAVNIINAPKPITFIPFITIMIHFTNFTVLKHPSLLAT